MSSAAFEAEFGFVAARIRPGDACGFFEDAAALLRLDVDDLADLSLPTMAGERAPVRHRRKQLHVAGAHLPAVDPEMRARLALDPPGNLDQSPSLKAAGARAADIVERQADLRRIAPGRLPCQRR